MKYIEYINEHSEFNFDWCKPYTNNDLTHTLVMYDGIASDIDTPDTTMHRYGGGDFEAALETLAREVNENYELFSGYTDTEIALDAMHETGCAHCPFRHECEAMQADMDDADYR